MIEYVWWIPLLLWVVGWNQSERKQVFLFLFKKFSSPSFDWSFFLCRYLRFGMSPIIVSLHLEFILRCHLLNLRVSRQHCDSSELKQRTGVHYTCFSRKSCIYNNFFPCQSADPSNWIELYNKCGNVVLASERDGQTWDIYLRVCMPSSFFREVNLTQIAMMGISSAYRHHGDLHVAGIYFSFDAKLMSRKTKQTTKTTNAKLEICFILDRID